jgi:hypothetical protein
MFRAFRGALLPIAITGVLLGQARVWAASSATAPAVTVSFSKGTTEIRQLKLGVAYFDNRTDFTVTKVNPELEGLSFTSRPAGPAYPVTISAPAGATVYLLITSDVGPYSKDKGMPQLRQTLLASGWTRVAGDCARLPSPECQLAVYKQTFTAAYQANIRGAGHSGIVVVAANLVLGDNATNTAPPPVAQQLPPASSTPNRVNDQPAADNKPAIGSTPHIAAPQATINILAVLTESGKELAGQETECILTATPGKSPKKLEVQFGPHVGEQMKGVTDDVLRYLRIRYPQWYVENAEITFGDRGNYDGPSIGAAIGTLIRSVIEGFSIDPNAAITGDIAANGVIHPIGGLSYKLRGAKSGDATLVAVPLKNYDNLVDAIIYRGPAIVTDVQVIGMSSLDDAVAIMRTDRTPELTKAIALFGDVQTALKDDPRALYKPAMQSQLQTILSLAPNHLSAKLLLMVGERKMPATLSPTASLYYTDAAVSVMLPILKNRDYRSHPVPSSTVRTQLAELDKLRPMADPKIQPLIDAWSHFLRAWTAQQSGEGSYAEVNGQLQKLQDEVATVNADPDLNQKLLNEGM